MIIGGGLIGCELAVELKRNRCDCTIIEMTDGLAEGSPYFHKIALMEELRQIDRIYTNAICTAIDENGVHIADCNGMHVTLPPSRVFIACGIRSNKELETLRRLVPIYIPIGDCYRPGKIGNAIIQAFDMVLDMEY